MVAAKWPASLEITQSVNITIFIRRVTCYWQCGVVSVERTFTSSDVAYVSPSVGHCVANYTCNSTALLAVNHS